MRSERRYGMEMKDGKPKPPPLSITLSVFFLISFVIAMAILLGEYLCQI